MDARHGVINVLGFHSPPRVMAVLVPDFFTRRGRGGFGTSRTCNFFFLFLRRCNKRITEGHGDLQ